MATEIFTSLITAGQKIKWPTHIDCPIQSPSMSQNMQANEISVDRFPEF